MWRMRPHVAAGLEASGILKADGPKKRAMELTRVDALLAYVAERGQLLGRFVRAVWNAGLALARQASQHNAAMWYAESPTISCL